MRKAVLALVLGAGLAISPATAQDELQDQDNQEGDSAAEAAREGLESLMRALELMLDSIPMFEMPEILPNGDIIIRRVDPDAEEDKKLDEDGEGSIDETST